MKHSSLPLFILLSSSAAFGAAAPGNGFMYCRDNVSATNVTLRGGVLTLMALAGCASANFNMAVERFL